MEKTTTNIIYLYNNITECIENYDGEINEHTWLCIETGFQHMNGEVFEISIKQADFEDRNMWSMVGLTMLDDDFGTLEKGIVRYLPVVSKVSQVIDEWFKYNK